MEACSSQARSWVALKAQWPDDGFGCASVGLCFVTMADMDVGAAGLLRGNQEVRQVHSFLLPSERGPSTDAKLLLSRPVTSPGRLPPRAVVVVMILLLGLREVACCGGGGGDREIKAWKTSVVGQALRVKLVSADTCRCWFHRLYVR